MTRKRVVIIGGGFGGLTAARFLHHADVILIDRTNHHLFQPLLYQVASAALPEGDIAWPLRTLFRSRPNVRVVMDEVVTIEQPNWCGCGTAHRSISMRSSSRREHAMPTLDMKNGRPSRQD